MLRRLLFLALVALLGFPTDASAAALPRVRVSPDGRGFVTTDGRPFVPFGINYYRPGTGWAPQVWKQFDPEATRRDFARLRELGANTVRVFLTYGSFMTQPGRLEPEGLARLDRFLDLAEEAGLYVHPTGPDHWEGLPEWAKGDRITDPAVLQALEGFWTALAAHLRGRPVVFAYDLLNEPEVPWDSPALRTRWNEWLARRYGTTEALGRAWRRTDVPPLGTVPPPPKDDALLDPRLLDFQAFREDVAEDWTLRQVNALRAADPDALVTVGLIQWSVPLVLAHSAHYSAFRPDRHARHLDFLSFHFYPFADGIYRYRSARAETDNLAYLEAVAREHARFGKPVVLAEFGWYGGGFPRGFGEGQPATEEDQARWCTQLVATTRPFVNGWLNWGFHDQPEATDPSQFTGLLRSDGAIKAWGREFQRLSRELTDPPHSPSRPAVARPLLDWDRLVTDRAARDAARREYTRAFEVAPVR